MRGEKLFMVNGNAGDAGVELVDILGKLLGGVILQCNELDGLLEQSQGLYRLEWANGAALLRRARCQACVIL
jgi:hypothetical protein